MRAIDSAWTSETVAAPLWVGPRKLDYKGHSTAGIETKRVRLRQFDEFRADIAKRLAGGDASAARSFVAASAFRDDILIAATRDEAIEACAALFVEGNNAIADSDCGDGILSVCLWRE